MRPGAAGGGNLRTMADGWREIWAFFARRAASSTAEQRRGALDAESRSTSTRVLPETLAIRRSGRSRQRTDHGARDAGSDALRRPSSQRTTRIAGTPARRADAAARLPDRGDRAPRGGPRRPRDPADRYGKSFIFQLPALALPGVTIVVSPLVALMTDQALGLNRSIGGAVRALVAPMRESNSRTGKAEVADALTNPHSRTGIRLVYVSPERLCQRQFQDWIDDGVERGIVTRIAIDEAHTFVTWGEDFRPSFKRAERLPGELRAHPNRPQLLALTATATPSVRVGPAPRHLRPRPARTQRVLGEVTRNPIRPELALYRRMLGRGEGGPINKQRLLEALVDATRRAHDHLRAHDQGGRARSTRRSSSTSAKRRADRIRLFHGRLTSSEKESVARGLRERAARRRRRVLPDDRWSPPPRSAWASTGRTSARSSSPRRRPTWPRSTRRSAAPAVTARTRPVSCSARHARSARSRSWTASASDSTRSRSSAIARPILDGTGPLDIEALARDLIALDIVAGIISVDDAEEPRRSGRTRALCPRPRRTRGGRRRRGPGRLPTDRQGHPPRRRA